MYGEGLYPNFPIDRRFYPAKDVCGNEEELFAEDNLDIIDAIKRDIRLDSGVDQQWCGPVNTPVGDKLWMSEEGQGLVPLVVEDITLI